MINTPPQIRMKGIRDGLLISLSNAQFPRLLEQLAGELAPKQDFLRGSRVVLEIGDQELDQAELEQLQAFLAGRGMVLWAVLAESPLTKNASRNLGLATRLPGSNTNLEGQLRDEPPPAPPPPPAPSPTNALFLKETIRSGRSIYHEDYVIIMGDVNAGAEIIAGKDVLVWGRLRGLVHAGAQGDQTAQICALELSPTQLRIADKIAMPPKDNRHRATNPEVALIRNGQIVAEPWRLKD